MLVAYTNVQSSTSRAAYKKFNRVFGRCYQTVAKTLLSRSRDDRIKLAWHVAPTLRDDDHATGRCDAKVKSDGSGARMPVGAECGVHLRAGSQHHPCKALLLAGEPRRRHGDAERRDDDAGVADRPPTAEMPMVSSSRS